MVSNMVEIITQLFLFHLQNFVWCLSWLTTLFQSLSPIRAAFLFPIQLPFATEMIPDECCGFYLERKVSQGSAGGSVSWFSPMSWSWQPRALAGLNLCPWVWHSHTSSVAGNCHEAFLRDDQSCGPCTRQQSWNREPCGWNRGKSGEGLPLPRACVLYHLPSHVWLNKSTVTLHFGLAHLLNL